MWCSSLTGMSVSTEQLSRRQIAFLGDADIELEASTMLWVSACLRLDFSHLTQLGRPSHTAKLRMSLFRWCHRLSRCRRTQAIYFVSGISFLLQAVVTLRTSSSGISSFQHLHFCCKSLWLKYHLSNWNSLWLRTQFHLLWQTHTKCNYIIIKR